MLVIALTGGIGAGKSTVARVLYARFLEMGGRPVTLLDGDIVRRNLSQTPLSRWNREIVTRHNRSSTLHSSGHRSSRSP